MEPPPIANQDAQDEPSTVIPQITKVSEEVDRFISVISDAGDDQSESLSPPEFLHQFAHLFDAKLVEYESDSKKWIQLTEDESSSFIQHVDRTARLLNPLSKFHSEQKYADAINRITAVQQRAMSFMEIEFKSILEDYQTSYDRDQNSKTDEAKTKQLSSSCSSVQEASQSQPEPPPDQSESQPDKDDFLGYSDEMVSNLNRLAKALVEGGHETECCELYFFVRRNAIEQNLKDLKFEKLSIDEVQKMQWEPLEKEVTAWMKIFKEFTSSLLPSERKLADAVFSDGISESLFGKLTRGVLFCLITFAESITLTKRSPEKLFKFLDVYETLRDRIPELEKLISFEYWLNQLKSGTSMIRSMLGESILKIFGELENSIKADTSKTQVPGGAVHPLTRYTMNYLTLACEYSDTLDQVFREHKKVDPSDSENQSQPAGESPSPFPLELAKVMDQLDANLETKSKLYKDPSLSLIFMMNNGRYILQKTKGGGGMRSLMGDPWVRKRSSDLRSYHTNYKRETWTKLLQCLSPEGLSVNGKVVKPVLKERFKSFNAMFDEIHRTQSTWVVSDEQLQSELRVSISAIVIPAYRSFMGRYSQVFTPGRQTEKYIKYQPEDIEACIEELFEGTAGTPQGKRR